MSKLFSAYVTSAPVSLVPVWQLAQDPAAGGAYHLELVKPNGTCEVLQTFNGRWITFQRRSDAEAVAAKLNGG